MLMPAARIDGRDWFYESNDILSAIGYDKVPPDAVRAMFAAWQGVFHRPDSAFTFFREFSLASDPATHPVTRFVRNFLRAFGTFYFFLVIRWAVFRNLRPDPHNFTEQFLYWENKLINGKFRGGDKPDATDIMLFGIIQCHASIPVPPLFALQQASELEGMRRWLGDMQTYFHDYPYLYSNLHFTPASRTPDRASLIDQLAFWAGAVTMFMGFPLTIPLVVFLAARQQRARPRRENAVAR